MTIDDLKRALVEVQRICYQQISCDECPFRAKVLERCPMGESLYPEDWPGYAWEVDENETD